MAMAVVLEEDQLQLPLDLVTVFQEREVRRVNSRTECGSLEKSTE